MNKDRRAALAALSDRAANAFAELEAIKDELESLKGEEEEYKENMPDSFKDGDKGSKADEAISAMESAIEMLDNLDASEFSGFIDTASE